jgi:hypothetical protein
MKCRHDRTNRYSLNYLITHLKEGKEYLLYNGMPKYEYINTNQNASSPVYGCVTVYSKEIQSTHTVRAMYAGTGQVRSSKYF